MTEPKPTLATLPDDVLFLILEHIDTARGIADISRTSKRLYNIVRSDGWAIFARGRFPSLSLPPLSTHSPPGSDGSRQPLTYNKLCNSLTWQSRAWDRRSIVLRALVPQHQQLRRSHAAHFHPIIAAHHDLPAGQELVAWGAGQDVVGRWRHRRSPNGRGNGDAFDVNVKWARLHGSSIDYGPGRDDVTALALVKAPLGGAGGETMGILAGRENGHLALLSAKMDKPEDFGRVLTTFRPEDGVVEPRTTKSVLTSTSRICSLDMAKDGKTMAVATQASLRLYAMPEEAIEEVRPVEVYRLNPDDEDGLQVGKGNNKLGALHKAKWMPGGDVLALSITDHPDPIQCLRATPSGMEVTAAAKNIRLERQNGELSNRICPNSIEPIPPSSTTGGNGNLLLSAWRDGTVRLQDLRTPSSCDVVYQDNVDPWSRFESLLPFGTERFLAGGLDGSVVKIFDFRLPRTYHYSAALPCSERAPMPPPSQPFMRDLSLLAFEPRAYCHHMPLFLDNCNISSHIGRCNFHHRAPHLFYRPNCSLFFHVTRDQPVPPPGTSRRGFPADPRRVFPSDPGVWSLARGADLSPHFYIGVAGGLVEASLQDADGKGDPNFEMRPLDMEYRGKAGLALQAGVNGRPVDTASEAQYADLAMDYSIMETGDGLRYPENEKAIRLPKMIRRRELPGEPWNRIPGQVGEELRKVWRLDAAFEAEW